MQQDGLYFPFIHVRDDEWLKTAALYWPSIRRLVPRPYSKHDSPTARIFSEAGILRDEEPRDLGDFMAWKLLDTVKENADRLTRDFSVERAIATWDGPEWGEGSGQGRARELGWIHVTKFPPGLGDFLVERGLADRWRGDDPYGDRWMGLHPALAGAYMTALAGYVSEQAYLQPLTDQADLRVATPNSDVQAAISLLLGRTPDDLREGGRYAPDVDGYIMLALHYARPENLAAIDAEKIVQCREDLREELENFWRYIGSQRAELAELTAIPLKSRKLEAFAKHAEQTIERPLRNLEKGLRLHRLETTRSMLMAGSLAPPLAAGAALSFLGAPSVATTATGAIAAIGTAWWKVKDTRQRAKADSPVGYLLDVRDQLTPRTLAGHVRKVLHGTYG